MDSQALIPTLIGVPFDGASSYQRGPAKAPPVIRAALTWDSSNTWTEDGLDTAAPGSMADAGDLDLPADATAAAVLEPITAGVRRVLDQGGRPLVLGGDHSITYPVLRAMRERYPALAVLHFDAHGDLYQDYLGDRLSHACPFARALEDRLVDRLVQVGIRTLNKHQWDQAARYGVDVIDMRRWNGPPRLRFTQPLYISLDLDVLDPAFIAGIGHPEPGGLSVRDVIATIQQLEGRIVGADVVELNPDNDSSSRSSLVAAKFVKELVGAMHRSPAP